MSSVLYWSFLIPCLCVYIDTWNPYYVTYAYVDVILRVLLLLPKHLNQEHEHCNPLMNYFWC